VQVLEEYIRQIQDLPIAARFSLFTAFYIFERITLTTEFLPIGFVLPFVSPVVFGGVAAGASLTALAATLGSSVNFFLGKTVLKERVRSSFPAPNDGPRAYRDGNNQKPRTVLNSLSIKPNLSRSSRLELLRVSV
jgi:hypothetical protein